MNKRTVSPMPLDWPYFYDRVSTIPELSEELRKDGKAAFAFLEKELGKGFLKSCGKNHPVEHKIMMAGGEGQLKEFIKWVEALQKLKATNSNFDYLIEKMRSVKDAYAEGMPFADIGARHLNQGFGVNFPKEIPDQKNADLELTFLNTGERVHVEVTRISEGRDREMQDALYRRLLNVCLWYGNFVHNAGKLYEMMPEEEWPGLIRRVKQMKEAAYEKGELVAYQDKYLAIAFAHPDCVDELDDCCSVWQLPRRFDGFDVEFDYTKRILKTWRIYNEAKQIPKDGPGMIYCPVHILYPLTMNVPDTVAAFAKELEKYNNIFGLVFYGEVMPPLSEEFTEEGQNHIYALRQNEAYVGRYTLLVKNPSFNLPLSAAAKTALISAAF